MLFNGLNRCSVREDVCMYVCMRKLGSSDVTCVKVSQVDHCGDCGFCAALVNLELEGSGLDYKSTDYAGARIIGGAQ